MAVELRFRKTDATPWGFRLTGGADFDSPLTVIKVTEDSIAENVGMQVGDLIVRIDDVATSGLTHTQAHNYILNAGNDFVLVVQRSDLSNLPSKLLLERSTSEAEFGEENKRNMMAEDSDLNITDEEIVNIIGEPPHNFPDGDAGPQIESEVQQAVTAEDDEKKLASERKWSTFLQKPRNAKPKPRPTEEEAAKGPPYRVIITKQPKKSLETSEPILDVSKSKIDDGAKDSDEEVVELEEEIQESDCENKDPSETEDVGLGEDDEAHSHTSIQSQSGDEIEEIEEDPEAERKTESDERKLSAGLEEQLIQVQKQLLALSKLPSSIQSTLNAVTQQLDLLVGASQHRESDEEEVVEEEEQEEIVEGMYVEKALSTLDEEDTFEEDEAMMEKSTIDEEEEPVEFGSRMSGEEVVYEDQIMTEEEIDAQREEQERLEKKEKVNKWNHMWPWSDVSKPVYRINFLKYQPPPKNLDHLQRSDVYKLIHDMEPPARGIGARDVTIRAEQDYYAQKEESVSSLSPQMER